MDESLNQTNTINSLELNIQFQKYNKELKAKMKNRFKRGVYLSSGWLCLNLLFSLYYHQSDNTFLLYAHTPRGYTPSWYIRGFEDLIKLILFIQNIITLSSISSSPDKDNSILKLLFKSLRYPYCFMQVLISSNFSLSIYYSYHPLFLWSNLILDAVSLVLAYICYLEIKRQKNISSSMLITLFTFISVISSFTFYRFLYLSLLILAKRSSLMLFTVNLMQLSLGIVLLSYFKDIFFILTSLALQTGNMLLQYSLRNETAMYQLIAIDAFSIAAVAFTAIRYRNSVIGKSEGNDSIMHLLEHKDS